MPQCFQITQEHWKEDAVNTFSPDYVVNSEVIIETFQFIPSMSRTPILCVHLKEALQAADFISLGNQLGLYWMVTEASLAYSPALPLLADILQDDAKRLEDSTLATTVLLGLCEVFSFLTLIIQAHGFI